MYRNKKYIEFFEMFNDIRWLINLIVVIFFLIYVKIFGKNDINLINASKKAILGFIIAIFAYLDMTIASFWIIFVLAYYGNNLI